MDPLLLWVWLCDSRSLNRRDALSSRKRRFVFGNSRRRIAGQIAVAEISRQCAEYGQYQRPLALREKELKIGIVVVKSSPIKLSSPATREFWEVPVLYEDEDLLALNKP